MPSFSRTFRTNGDDSYPHNSIGSICSLSGRALACFCAPGMFSKIAQSVFVKIEKLSKVMGHNALRSYVEVSFGP